MIVTDKIEVSGSFALFTELHHAFLVLSESWLSSQHDLDHHSCGY